MCCTLFTLASCWKAFADGDWKIINGYERIRIISVLGGLKDISIMNGYSKESELKSLFRSKLIEFIFNMVKIIKIYDQRDKNYRIYKILNKLLIFCGF